MAGVKNAPPGILSIVEYEGYEQHTSDWKIAYQGGDFAMWEYFDGCAWKRYYCVCYKGKAFEHGSNFGNVRDAYSTSISLFELMNKINENKEVEDGSIKGVHSH